VKITAVPVATLKKFAAGHGAATKEMMAAALEKIIGDKVAGLDDNAIDAYHLLLKALSDLKP
jgi:hypothetical protein